MASCVQHPTPRQEVLIPLCLRQLPHGLGDGESGVGGEEKLAGLGLHPQPPSLRLLLRFPSRCCWAEMVTQVAGLVTHLEDSRLALRGPLGRPAPLSPSHPPSPLQQLCAPTHTDTLAHPHTQTHLHTSHTP